jgi:hypothetical protein
MEAVGMKMEAYIRIGIGIKKLCVIGKQVIVHISRQ